MSGAGVRVSWWARRSLRHRLALLSAVAVAIAVASASALTYLVMSQALRHQVDAALVGILSGATVGETAPSPTPSEGSIPGEGQDELSLGDIEAARVSGWFDPEVLCSAPIDLTTRFRTVIGSIQLVRTDGTTCTRDAVGEVVPTAEDVAVANGGPATGPRDDVTSTGTHVRVRTVPVGGGYALLVARDLTEVDDTLSRLALVLVLATGAGAVLATIVGLLVAKAGLRPIDDLTRAAERIADTQDLDTPIELHGQDEVSRLAAAFNAMTSALAQARERQQQLVADASHELRTPLTSLRTNVELLVRSETTGRALPADDKQALLESVTAQLGELGDLVSELTVLSHDEPARGAASVRLDEVVRRAAERAARRGDHQMHLDLEPWEFAGDPVAMERAVLNVLDNAVKFSPAGSSVEIRLRKGTVTVTDSGPGIPEVDRGRVFDRFWRSPDARAMPGSGLGLAIVADTLDRHGGAVSASASTTGGAVISLVVPGNVPQD